MDLASYACNHETADDGTGKAFSPVQNHFSEMETALEKTRIQERQALIETFEKPENTASLRQAFRGLGVGAAGLCADASQCPEAVAEAISQKMKAELHGKLLSDESNELGVKGQLKAWDQFKKSNLYQQAVVQFSASYDAATEHPALVDTIQNHVLPDLKEILKAKLNEWVEDPRVREQMAAKIETVDWGGTKCKLQFGGSEILPGAGYFDDKGPPVVKLCKGYFMNVTSLYAAAMTLGHELSHSIDPCNIGVEYRNKKGEKVRAFQYRHRGSLDIANAESEYPVKGVLQCLRSDQSIAAKGSTSDSMYTMIRAVDRFFRPNDTGVPVDQFCANDEIPEAMADWMGAELMAAYTAKIAATPGQRLAGYANAFRFMCSPGSDQLARFILNDHHAEDSDRINKIVLANPTERQQLGCGPLPAGRLYCSTQSQPILVKSMAPAAGEKKQ